MLIKYSEMFLGNSVNSQLNVYVTAVKTLLTEKI